MEWTTRQAEGQKYCIAEGLNKERYSGHGRQGTVLIPMRLFWRELDHDLREEKICLCILDVL